MLHRHLDLGSAVPPEHLPGAAVVDLLERGDLQDWQPLARAIQREPYANLATRVLAYCSRFPMYGTSPLWRAWIDTCRARVDGMPNPNDAITMAELRRDRGLTQTEVARRIGMSQSDLSKFERRSDLRLSTLRLFAEGIGGGLEVWFRDGRYRRLLRWR